MSGNGLELEFKPDFERAREYWSAFWKHELIDRPACCVEVCGEDVQGFRGIQGVDADFDEYFREGDAYLRSVKFMGEAMPSFRCGFGPDQLAGFCGAPIVVSEHSKTTTWSEKIVEDWAEFLPIQLQEDGHTWQRMLEFHRRADEYVKGKCLLAMIDLHSNIDLLEALRGAQKLLFDLIDKPELVTKAMTDARKIYRQVYEKLWPFGDRDKYGCPAGTRTYAAGKHSPIQADFICLIGPDMFRQFVLPALEEEAAYLDEGIFHLDGPDALKHLDDILAIDGIEAIQWVSGAGNKDMHEWTDVFEKVHRAGKATIIYAPPERVKQLHKQLPANLVVYHTVVRTEAQGQELLDWLVKNT